MRQVKVTDRTYTSDLFHTPYTVVYIRSGEHPVTPISLVQTVIVVPRRRSVVDHDQVAVGIVRISVQRVIAYIANHIVGKTRRIDDVVSLIEADAERRTALRRILCPAVAIVGRRR